MTTILHDQYVMVNNIKTRYWQAGNKGPVIVLIHGFAASVEDWIFNINQLAKNIESMLLI